MHTSSYNTIKKSDHFIAFSSQDTDKNMLVHCNLLFSFPL